MTIIRHKNFLAEGLLIIMVVIFASTYFVTKDHLVFIDPWAMVCYRYLGGAVAVGVFLLFRGHSLFKAFWPQGFWVGFCLWMTSVSQTIGLQFTTASNSAFISGCFVAFVPALLIVFFKRSPGMLGIATTILAVAGLWMITGGVRGANKGDTLTLITAAGSALFIVFTDHYLKQARMHPATLCFQALLTTGVLSLILMALFARNFHVGSMGTWWALAYLAFVATALTFIVNNYVQKKLTPMKVAMIYSLEPVIAAVFALLFIGESLTWLQWLGGGLIVVALGLSGAGVKSQ